MRVGVFLDFITRSKKVLSLPHARGGVSNEYGNIASRYLSSPCAWGCFSNPAPSSNPSHVFPMRVGVFPAHRVKTIISQGLPHARGGVSCKCSVEIRVHSSSPCAWGCFYRGSISERPGGVFPMRVGVFPLQTGLAVRSGCLPHARGGVSNALRSATLKSGLPHARGGVS